MTKYFLLLSFILSCSHHTPQKKAKVEFNINEEWITKEASLYSREPASAEEFLQEVEASEKLKNQSLRRVYFKSLYAQVLEASNSFTIRSCPQFHHDKLLVDEAQHALNFRTPRAFNDFSKEKIAELKSELVQLCEEGTSENYFKVENIVTYFAQKKDFTQGVKGFYAFIKVPTFNHMILKNSLNKESPEVDLGLFEEELLNYTGAWQIRTYAVQLKKKQVMEYVKN